MIKKTHSGVYGIIMSGDTILLVRKSRGPYIGTLDLVGGRSEQGETPEQTLMREVQEEAGILVLKATFWYEHTHQVKYHEHGQDIELHHSATVYKIDSYDASSFMSDIHTEDVQGAGWYKISDLNVENLSPLALYAVSKIKQ